MKSKVKYYFRGFFFDEHSVLDISDRSIKKAIEQAPDGAFAFSFYDVQETPDLGPEFEVRSVPLRESGMYFIDAEVFSLGQLRAKNDPSLRILITNMESNGWEYAVHCRTGNWKPFEQNDRLV